MEKIQAYRQIKKYLLLKKKIVSALSSMISLFTTFQVFYFILEFRIEFYQNFCIRTLNFNSMHHSLSIKVLEQENKIHFLLK